MMGPRQEAQSALFYDFLKEAMFPPIKFYGLSIALSI